MPEPLVGGTLCLSLTRPEDTTAICAALLEVGSRKRTAWKDATFEVRRREFVAIIGLNDARKTTPFHLLPGPLWPARRTLEVCGATNRRGNPSESDTTLSGTRSTARWAADLLIGRGLGGSQNRHHLPHTSPVLGGIKAGLAKR